MSSKKVFLLLVLVGVSHGFHITTNRGGTYFYRGCSEDEFDTLWPDYLDNNAYYVCTGVGFTERKFCSNRLVFSFQQQVCVWKWEWQNPPSSSDIAPIKRLVKSRENSKTKDCKICWYPACAREEDLHVLWPDYDDTTLFSQCSSFGNYVSQTCPKGTVFNFQAQVCGWPHEWTILPLDPSNLIILKPETISVVPNEIISIEATQEKPFVSLEHYSTQIKTLSTQPPKLIDEIPTLLPSTAKVLTTSEKFAKRFGQIKVKESSTSLNSI